MRRRRVRRKHNPRRLTLESLESRAMLHAGGLLSGSVYIDTDGDGSRGADEPGMPGVVVRLSDANSTVNRSAITDDNGLFIFDELEPGTYQVSKRQSPATFDGQESTSLAGAVSGDNVVSNVVLEDDQNLSGIDFGERGLRPEFVSIAWFFASSPPPEQMLRETIARSEELAGDTTLAASIRAGGSTAPDIPDTPTTPDTPNNDTNNAPAATDDTYTVEENGALTVNAATGVLANDTDADGNTLTASVVGQPASGAVTLNGDGSFTYTPNNGFSGSDTFTYVANDGTVSSNVATVRITVTPIDDGGNDDGNNNVPFDPVTPGSIDDPGLLGVRMDTQPGAAPLNLDHTSEAVDYTNFGNPPSYGPHHAFIPGITPRPTGVYETEQPDEDLVHNLEHGHVWISYNPSLISNDDHLALEQFVRDGGTDTGVIVTPRARNTSPIVLTSLTRQLTLDTFDATTIRAFINTNRGHSPEGFIPSGQKLDGSGEDLDDGLAHSS